MVNLRQICMYQHNKMTRIIMNKININATNQKKTTQINSTENKKFYELKFGA